MGEAKKVIVMGFGEVGQPIPELASKHHQAFGVDVSAPAERVEGVGVMHICDPFGIEDFVVDTTRSIELFWPGLTIIHSTVVVGTMRAVAKRIGTAVVKILFGIVVFEEWPRAQEEPVAALS